MQSERNAAINGWLARALIVALLSGLAGVATAGWVAVRQTQIDTAAGTVRVGTLEDRVGRIENTLEALRREVVDLRTAQERVATQIEAIRQRLEETLDARR